MPRERSRPDPDADVVPSRGDPDADVVPSRGDPDADARCRGKDHAPIPMPMPDAEGKITPRCGGRIFPIMPTIMIPDENISPQSSFFIEFYLTLCSVVCYYNNTPSKSNKKMR